jgi:ABC-2 type transport system ATP-binding protein
LRPRADIVATDGLVKRYGPRLAVDGVSFSIAEGEIIGLLGPNGSGKSTVLRILTGYLPPSRGSVSIAGYDAWEHPQEIRRHVGYVPEDAPLYDGMRVSEFLRFMAEIKGVPRIHIRDAVAAAHSKLDLQDVMATPIGKLSRGYRQRVAIAQALLNDPPILVFDEPTNALDAYQVIGVRELISGLAGKRTVIVASHVLTEIEKLATRVMILRDGVLLTADAMAEAGGMPRFRLRISGVPEAVLTALRAVPGVVRADAVAVRGSNVTDGHDYLLEVERPGIAPQLGRAVIQHGFALAELVAEKPSLERVFLELTRRATGAAAA